MTLLNVLTVIFSAVVAFSTVQYVRLTRALVSETRKMREAQTTPNVLVTVEPEAGNLRDLYLAVRNIGLTPAYDIKFNISPDIEIAENYPLSKVGFIKDGLSVLAPGQEMKTFLIASWSSKYKENMNAVLKVEILYKGASDDVRKQSYQIDLSQFKGIITVTTSSSYDNQLLEGIKDIARGLEKIREEGLRTVIYKSIEDKEEDYDKYWKKLTGEARNTIEEFKKKKEKEDE